MEVSSTLGWIREECWQVLVSTFAYSELVN